MTQEEAIRITQKELSDHESEWKERFEYYMTKTIENKPAILERRKKFHKWGN